MARPERFELPTYRTAICCSIQLSYGRKVRWNYSNFCNKSQPFLKGFCMFHDRADAGEALAKALAKYAGRDDVIVLAIPRGGVEVGAAVAKRLGADFDMIMCRKLQYPYTTESGYGAICEDGTIYINEAAAANVSQSDIYRQIEIQKAELAHRIQHLRGGRALKDVRDKIVILVDDGIAMGSTMIAAISMLRKLHPKKIVVAVPTASPRVVEYLRSIADDVVALYTPEPFYAVADAYANWYDVSDEEVLEILRSMGEDV